MPGKVLGLDIGSKYIGCALADWKGISLEPLVPLERKNNSLCLSALKKIAKENKIEKIIIGYPLSLNHQTNSFSRKIKAMAHKFKKHLTNVEIKLVHEGLSTWVTKQDFPNLALKKSSATPLNLDSFSALEILKTYFQQREKS